MRVSALTLGGPVVKVRRSRAEVAKLVDALASGASGGNPVEVQVLSSAPVAAHTSRILYKALPINAFCMPR